MSLWLEFVPLVLSVSVPVPPVGLLVDVAEEPQLFVLEPVVYNPVPVAPVELELLAPVEVAETSEVPPAAFVVEVSRLPVADPLTEPEVLELPEVASTSVLLVPPMLLLVASVPVVPENDVSLAVVDDDAPLWIDVLS